MVHLAHMWAHVVLVAHVLLVLPHVVAHVVLGVGWAAALVGRRHGGHIAHVALVLVVLLCLAAHAGVAHVGAVMGRGLAHGPVHAPAPVVGVVVLVHGVGGRAPIVVRFVFYVGDPVAQGVH